MILWYVLFFFNCALPNYHYIVTPPISPIPLLQRQQYHHLILQPTSSPIPTELPLLHQNTTITPSTYPVRHFTLSSIQNEYSSVEVTNSPVTITPSNTSSDQYHVYILFISNNRFILPHRHPENDRFFIPPSLIYRIIINPTPHRTFPNTSFVVADAGIVFYVYAPNHCAQKLRYLNEIGSTTHYVKTLNSTVFHCTILIIIRPILLLLPIVIFLMNSMTLSMFSITLMKEMFPISMEVNGILECCTTHILLSDSTMFSIPMCFLVIQLQHMIYSLNSIIPMSILRLEIV